MLTPIHIDAEITLRAFRESDAAPMFEIIERDREYLAEFLPWVDDVATVEDEAEFVKNTMSQPTTGTEARASFIIEYRSEIAGTIGVRLTDSPSRIGEIGYLLAEPMQHKGVMTRACEAVTRHGFAEMDLRRIEIYADPENPRSRAIPLRLGYSDDGISPYAMRATGKTRQMAAYSMTIEDWRTRPA